MNIDNIKVLGFRVNISSVSDTLNKVNKIKEEFSKDFFVQLLDADAIAGREHVIHAINQAILAFDRNENLANDLGVEILLRSSAQRQISKAFDMLGIKPGKSNLCIVLINCSNEFVDRLSDMFIRDDDVLIADNSKLRDLYDISEKEIRNLYMEDIIIDRITKLVVDY